MDDTYILAAGSGSWKWELEVGKRSHTEKNCWELRNRVSFLDATVRAGLKPAPTFPQKKPGFLAWGKNAIPVSGSDQSGIALWMIMLGFVQRAKP